MSDDYDETPNRSQEEAQGAKAHYEQLMKKIDANGGIKPVLISEGLNPYAATKILKDEDGYYTEVENDDFRNHIVFISGPSDELSLRAHQWCTYYHNLALIPHSFILDNDQPASSEISLNDTTFNAIVTEQTGLVVQKLEEYREKRAAHLDVDASSLPLSAPDATLSSRVIMEQPPVATATNSQAIQNKIDALKPVCVVVLGGVDVQVAASVVLRPKVDADGVQRLVSTLPDMLAAMM